MDSPHCPTCASYEDAVIALPAGGTLAPELAPCKEYVMTQRMRDHIVGQMRKDVMGQVSLSGLDRMAMVKGKKQN